MAYSTISKPSLHFNTKLYTGNGGTQSITGVGFQPDWVWFKSRTTTNNHALFDAVRGATKWIESNSTSVEQTYAGGLTSFDSDGFSVGNGSDVNLNSSSQVAWNWKAGGAGSTNTDGSQSATVSVNTTAGFSIVKFVNNQSYTTNTFGHGLGAVPKVIIMRSLDSAYNWDVHHHKVAIDKRLKINDSSGESSSTYMNSTSPTNQVFTVKSDEFDTNDDCIAYCFAEKKGYSKFGSYTGNASTNGPFIYTGFKPAWVLQKNYTSGSSNDWTLADNKRPGYNEINKRMVPNNSSVEATNNQIDFVSNGFKIRGSETNANGSGQTYVYLAFAEEPLVANVGASIPATAE